MNFPHNNKILYKVEAVTKTFESDREKIDAVLNVSFKVKKGELVVIVGPSGCGKTTLLRLLAYLIEPTKGKITFKDKVDSKSGKNRIGFVFQDPTLMPWRTVIDNIVLPLEIAGKERKEMHEEAVKLMKLLNLMGFERYYPAELSGGMSQRVAIARALMQNPLVLLMDEPFSALDEMIRQKLNFELLDLKRKANKTIVFVTHSILEAVILADRIIIMGLYPNTIIGSVTISLPKRTPQLLSKPIFFQNVEKVRKIIEENNQYEGKKLKRPTNVK